MLVPEQETSNKLDSVARFLSLPLLSPPKPFLAGQNEERSLWEEEGPCAGDPHSLSHAFLTADWPALLQISVLSSALTRSLPQNQI